MNSKGLMKISVILVTVAVCCTLNAFGQKVCGLGLSNPVTPEGPGGLFAGSIAPEGSIDLVENIGDFTIHIHDSCGNQYKPWKDSVVPTVNVISWRTHLKLLGANYGWVFVESNGDSNHMIVPNGQGGSISQQEFHPFADPFIMPLSLAWHHKRWEANVGVGWQLPANKYIAPWKAFAQDPPVIVQEGWGRVTTSLAFGGTYNITPTIAFSLANNYEWHGHQLAGVRFTEGQLYHNAWGLSKVFIKDGKPVLVAGPVGFTHWMVTQSTGPDLAKAGLTPGVRPHGESIGFEFGRPFLKTGLTTMFTYQNVVYGRSLGQGSEYWVTLVYNVRKPGREKGSSAAQTSDTDKKIIDLQKQLDALKEHSAAKPGPPPEL